MHSVNRSLILPYSAAEMYALANNVDRYREFLPWCNDSQVLDHGEGYAVARIDIRHRGIATSFPTHNRLIADEHILMEYCGQDYPEDPTESTAAPD